MKIDFVASDRPLIQSASAAVQQALTKAASAVRSVGHNPKELESDLGYLGLFEKRYKGKQSEDSDKAFTGTLDVPESECAVMRTGILLLLERHQRTDSKLQEDLALIDKDLSGKLGELRRLGMRFGGQADLFDTVAAKEKQAMAAEMGLSGAALGAAPVGKSRRKSGPAKGNGSPKTGRDRRKR